MNLEIKLERLSPGSKEGRVGKIHVEIGQEIEAGDLIMEVEGKKGNTPVKSIMKGIITTIEVDEGDSVKIGQLLTSISTKAQAPKEVLKMEEDNIKELPIEETAYQESLEADIAILGGGPGGYVAAIQAAKLGAKVIVIEKDELGGTCLNRGCIPTKALVRSAQVFADIKRAGEFGILTDNPAIDMAKVIDRKDTIVEELVEGIKHLFDKNKIILKSGTGKIIDKGIVEVDGSTIIKAKDIIIATGSEIMKPSFPGTDLKHVLWSDDALNLKQLPEKIVIIGGGIVGMEFAFIYADMGVDVSVIEYMDDILCMLDQDIIEEITVAAKQKGMKLYTSSKVEEILKGEGDNCIIKFTRGKETKYISSDKVLVCIGRNPQYEDIGIEAMKIKLDDEKCGIKVNDKMQTNIPSIYAIGDVTNIMQLAHVASHQGIVAVKNIFGENVSINYDAVPSAIFTNPEIAVVGISEKQILDDRLITIGKFPFAASGKAMTYGETSGFVKIIKEKETGKVIGGAIIGPHASDLVAELTLAIKNGLTANDIINTIHAHPTTSEAVHEATLSLEGGALHFAD